MLDKIVLSRSTDFEDFAEGFVVVATTAGGGNGGNDGSLGGRGGSGRDMNASFTSGWGGGGGCSGPGGFDLKFDPLFSTCTIVFNGGNDGSLGGKGGSGGDRNASFVSGVGGGGGGCSGLGGFDLKLGPSHSTGILVLRLVLLRVGGIGGWSTVKISFFTDTFPMFEDTSSFTIFTSGNWTSLGLSFLTSLSPPTADEE